MTDILFCVFVNISCGGHSFLRFFTGISCGGHFSFFFADINYLVESIYFYIICRYILWWTFLYLADITGPKKGQVMVAL